MTKFARLEEHDGMQVLAFTEAMAGEEGAYGPCLVQRCDPSVSVTLTAGPWADDEAGWDAAEAALASFDMAAFASKAKSMVKSFSNPE
jgi:hypothetical protein